MPISVAILIKLIKDIEPILNYTLTIPLIDSLNYTLLIFYSIKNWLYSTIKYLKALVSIIIPINFIEV